jgi:hypothetical protein
MEGEAQIKFYFASSTTVKLKQLNFLKFASAQKQCEKEKASKKMKIAKNAKRKRRGEKLLTFFEAEFRFACYELIFILFAQIKKKKKKTKRVL